MPVSAFLGDDDTIRCAVVVNDRGQYSIWPVDRKVPDGWRPTGFEGARSDCLSHIGTVWPDPTAPADPAVVA